MVTKKELVAQAESQNVYFRPSWSKQKIEEAIASGVKFGDLVKHTCPRSGIEFEVAIEDHRDDLVFPKCRYYLSHNNWEVRGPAVRVIESRKWDSWEELEAAIELELNPPPEPEPECAFKFEGDWVARITGASAKYRFSRDFVNRTDWADGKSGRSVYHIKQDGVYETCYKSRKGNESRCYYSVENGVATEISLTDVEALFPVIEEQKPSQPSLEGCSVVEAQLGAEGDTVEYDGQIVVIVKVDRVYNWEDEDGISGTGHQWTDCDILFEWYEFTTYYRPATEEEAVTYQEAKAQKLQKAKAEDQLKELARDILDRTDSQSPSIKYIPQGPKFTITPGYATDFQKLVLDGNKLWNLQYNGADGDDWSHNNVGGSHIGCYIEVDDSLKAKIEELMDIAAKPKE